MRRLVLFAIALFTLLFSTHAQAAPKNIYERITAGVDEHKTNLFTSDLFGRVSGFRFYLEGHQIAVVVSSSAIVIFIYEDEVWGGKEILAALAVYRDKEEPDAWTKAYGFTPYIEHDPEVSVMQLDLRKAEEFRDRLLPEIDRHLSAAHK